MVIHVSLAEHADVCIGQQLWGLRVGSSTGVLKSPNHNDATERRCCAS
jgi:hypothetical protein